MTDELFGIVPPVITPVNSDASVDEAAFRKVLRYLIDAGVNGLFVGGSAGEGPLFTLSEWTHMMEIAYDEVGDNVPLLGGAMETSTARVLEKVERLASIGYRYYVVNPVFYIKQTAASEHFRLFGTCKENDKGMELVAYNIPPYSQNDIPVEALAEMARRGWLQYCKDSAGSLEYLKRLIAAAEDTPLKVLTGDEFKAAESLRAGAVGVVPGCANFEPATYLQLYQAVKNGDDESARQASERILALGDNLTRAGSCWLSGIKYAMSCIGMGSGEILAPLGPLTPEQKVRVEAFVHQPSPLSAKKMSA
jgi:4-hydroxy-tetrahydrodipicolinate synthase